MFRIVYRWKKKNRLRKKEQKKEEGSFMDKDVPTKDPGIHKFTQ